MTFNVHTADSAPMVSAELLMAARKKFGFIPNLLGVMAEAPALLKAYMTLSGIFDESSFNATEKQVVLLAVSGLNGCTYCMAAHSAMAGMQGVSGDVIQALRNNTPIPDGKLEALRRLARDIVDTRGYPSDEVVKNFLDAGYKHAQILEVILGVGLKTLSNYTNHIAETPLDKAFEAVVWTPEKVAS